MVILIFGDLNHVAVLVLGLWVGGIGSRMPDVPRRSLNVQTT
jgi:hypothetical protein